MSTDIVMEYQERMRPSVTLCNAGGDLQEVQYSGLFYTFPPGEPVTIKDRLTFQRNVRGTPLYKQPLILDGPNAEASRIAKELLERCGDRGITVLFGDAQDQERLDRARKRWLSYKVGMAKMRQREWLLRMDRIMKEPGAVPPRQPADVRDALAFLEKYEAGLIDRKRFISKVDSEEFDTREECLAHNARRYADRTTKDPEAFVVDAHAGLHGVPKQEVKVPAEAPAPATPGADVAHLIDLAEKNGVTLSAEQYKGLLFREEQVIKDVVDVVAKAMAKPRRKNKEKDDG
jgi:hypothetical protein